MLFGISSDPKRDAASDPHGYLMAAWLFFFPQSFCSERGQPFSLRGQPRNGGCCSQPCVTHLLGIFDAAHYNSVQLRVPSRSFRGRTEG